MSCIVRAPRPYHCLLLACLFTLSSCASLSSLFNLGQEEPDQASVLKQRQKNASEFLYHLSVAGLFLENGQPVKTIGNNAAAINQYAKTGNDMTKPVPLTVAVIRYRVDKTGDTAQAIVPVGPGNPPAGYLSKTMVRMGKFKHTLEDITVVTIPVRPETSFYVKRNDGKLALESLHKTRDKLLAGKVAIPEQEAARIELSMLDYFIKHKHKDAAYLCADNIKRQLATAMQEHPDTQNDVNSMSMQFTELEGRLHTQMPY